MDANFLYTLISCFGTIVAALIGAAATIWAAHAKQEITNNQPRSHQTQQNRIHSNSVTTILKTESNTNKPNTILGVGSVLVGLILLCSSTIQSVFVFPYIFPFLFAVPAVILGIISIIVKKPWITLLAIVFNIIGFASIFLIYFIIVIDSVA